MIIPCLLHLLKLHSFWLNAPKQTVFENYDQVRIEFSAINYESPKSTQYRYRLNGGMWQLTTNPFVEYNALPAKKYRFDVQAKKVNSTWSNTESYQFETKAPWYFQWWAITLEIFLFCITSDMDCQN